jgi:biotin transport system substrate-specific component
MSIRDVVFIALFAAITAALGLAPPINAGFGVPITLQSMGVMLAGSILGARRGGLSQLLFVALVAAGLPLLAGGRGGLGVFATPSVGYLLAFPIAAFVIGLLAERFWGEMNFIKMLAINVLGGLLVIHALGILGWALVLGSAENTAFLPALALAALKDAAFIPGDIAKAVLAASAAMFVKRGYPVIEAR